MYGIKKIRIIICVSLSFILAGCGYRKEYFSKEELEEYSSPIVFAISAEDEKGYFMTLDDSSDKIYLEYSRIWDYDSANQTFLFSMTEDEEGIYEYDLKNESYKCLIDKSSLSQYLQIPDEEEIESVYYRLSCDEISGVYGDILFIYNKTESKYTYSSPLPDVSWGEAYGWLEADTYLFRDFETMYEINIETEEMLKIDDYLGTLIFLSADKTMGCSKKDENWFGAIYSRILIWDTSNYKIIKLHEATPSPAHISISDDHKYILFARGNGDENDQLLCIRIEDENLCTVYETEDNIVDVLW